MTTIEIKKTLLKEIDDLSGNALQEALDFVEFLKVKQWRDAGRANSSRQRVAEELRALETDSLIHLEEEFATYKEDYPHE